MDPRPRLAPPYGDEEPWGPDKRGPERRAETAAAGEPVPKGRPVLVELAGGPGMSPVAASAVARSFVALGFDIDESADVVSVKGDGGVENFIVIGSLSDADAEAAIEARPEVVKVWKDSPIGPF